MSDQGRNADILQSIVDDVPYTDPPQSRIEDLLLQVKEVIKEGGGTFVQADWLQSDTTAKDYIKNKPKLGTASAKDSTNTVTADSSDLVESGAVEAAIGEVQTKLNAKITVSSLRTLTVAGWDSTTLQQTVTFAHNTAKRNVIDITIGEMTTWGEYGVRAISETSNGITFECDDIPETDLTFRITSMEVS